MPKALFFNVPAHGHVNPSLPLVAELAGRGHQITYCLTPRYRANVEAAGAVFQPYATVGDDYFEVRGLNGTRPQRAAYALITTAGAILPDLLHMVRDIKPDYILFDCMCPWGYLVARVSCLPAVASLSLLPLGSVRSMLNWQALRTLLPMMLRNVDKGVAATRRARALGKHYNIPPLGLASILNAPGDLSISYTSSYFHPSANTVSSSVRFVGWTLRETLASEAFSFEQVQGRQLIYVSLGTLVNDDVAFFRTCIDAFAGSDAYVIISTGGGVSPDAFGVLPPNVAIYPWVPQSDVLERAALFVTHAGLGSIHDGLYCGLPLLLVPQQEEQRMNALRVVELGAGLMLAKAQCNVETIRANAAQLLGETRFTVEAQRIGASFRAAGGMPRAADEIEALLRKTND